MRVLAPIGGLVLIAVGLISTPAWPIAPPPAVVAIGAWNIQWLGRPDLRNPPSVRIAQEPGDLALYIRESSVDVLGLIEVSDNAPGQPGKNKTLLEAFAKIKDQTNQDWDHLLFPKLDVDDKDQLCGVAWNKAKAKVVGAPFRVPVPTDHGKPRQFHNRDLLERNPHAIKFSLGDGKTDVVLIVVHLKSNVDGVNEGRAQRAEEVKLLLDALPKVKAHFKDEDIIILGDTNITKNTELAQDLLQAARFTDLNDHDETTIWPRPAPFDRNFVPDHQPEFIGSALETLDHTSVQPGGQLLSQTLFRKRFSDHYMVFTIVKVLSDDD